MSAALDSDRMTAKRRELYCLGLAQYDFATAMTMCDELLARKVDEPDEVDHALRSSIVVTYARPFTGNRPYGPLPAKWSQFADPVDRATHELLRLLRRKTVAHSEVPFRTLYVVPPEGRTGGRIEWLRFVVASDTPTGWSIAATRQLCDRLGKRMSAEVDRLLEEVYPDGLEGRAALELIV